MIRDPALAALLDPLARFPAALSDDAWRAAVVVAERTTAEQTERWARVGLRVAASSYRSWEAARAYFNGTPAVLAFRGFDDMLGWAALGELLCASSPALAASFFSAQGEASSAVPLARLEALVELVRQSHRRNLGSDVLLCEVVRQSSRVLALLPDDLSALAAFVSALCRLPGEEARECFGTTLRSLSLPTLDQRSPFLAAVTSAAAHGWSAARPFLQAASAWVAAAPAAGVQRYLELARHVAARSPSDALTLFTERWTLLRPLDDERRAAVVEMALSLDPTSSQAALAFVTSAPSLFGSIGAAGTQRWLAQGRALLDENPAAGLAFLRLESRKSAQLLEQLSAGVALATVERVLAIYCQALVGRPVNVLPTSKLVERAIGWSSVEQATTEGTDIYLPAYVSQLPSRRENFAYYKMLASHQAGHLEFGTFDFALARPSTRYADLRPALAGRAAPRDVSWTEFGAFFALFPQRRLARDVFCVVEDARVDGRLMRHYAGLAEEYVRARRLALAGRGSRAWNRTRSACVEALLRLSLGESVSSFEGTLLEAFAQRSGSLLAELLSGEGAVEDSAEATIRLYGLIEEIARPASVDASLVKEDGELDETRLSDWLAGPGAEGRPLSGDGEENYAGVEAVEFRGELKPELVQALVKLRGPERPGNGHEAGLSAEALRALLEQGLELSELVLGDLSTSSPLLASNLVREGERDETRPRRKDEEEGDLTPIGAAAVLRESPGGDIQEYLYDEWDFRAEDYRPDWCTVKEHELPAGSPSYYEEKLQEYAELAAEVRRQFQHLRPELHERRRHLENGDELEMDAAVEAFVDRRARLAPSDKLYWRREKLRRDISVALLLDMSASTGDELKDPAGEASWYTQEYSSWEEEKEAWQRWMSRERRKRIIDLEKESLVLLVEALETVGDAYAIYGFSGHGRDDVQLYVVKELQERFGDQVKGRVAAIDAQRGTRMGPAIRHAAMKLAKQESRIKLLLLLSDGYPQDHDYGQDRTERDYALHDTRMALLEARRQEITPYCITVDQAGNDYLKIMCPDMGYEVVNDLESLPRRLPSLYRTLTSR